MRSLLHVARSAALSLGVVGLVLAVPLLQDEEDPLARARALAERGEGEAAAALLRTAVAGADPAAPSTASWVAELERLDPAQRATGDARRAGAEALLGIAKADREAGWVRVAGEMEALALALDPAQVRARLGAASLESASQSELEAYFGEPDVLPVGGIFELANGELRLKPGSGALLQCVGERPPARFVLRAELHHDGDQASFGLDFDLRDAQIFLRAELVLRDGQIEPRLSAKGKGNGSEVKVGAKTAWSASDGSWIPFELRFDGETAALRAGVGGSALELRVPPREGAGRLAAFVQFGRAGKQTRLRALRVAALEGVR